MKKTMKDWIRFAINNGYQGVPENFEIEEELSGVYDSEAEGFYIYEKPEQGRGRDDLAFNYTDVITSKSFLEAISRGLLKKMKWAKNGEYYYNTHNNNKYDTDCELIDEITTEQALAIRDGKLEDFINKILPKK